MGRSLVSEFNVIWTQCCLLRVKKNPPLGRILISNGFGKFYFLLPPKHWLAPWKITRTRRIMLIMTTTRLKRFMIIFLFCKKKAAQFAWAASCFQKYYFAFPSVNWLSIMTRTKIRILTRKKKFIVCIGFYPIYLSIIQGMDKLSTCRAKIDDIYCIFIRLITIRVRSLV